MEAYTLRNTPSFFLSELIFFSKYRSKETPFAENFTVAGTIREIKTYWDILQTTGPLYECFLKPSKSYLIVQEQSQNNAVEMFSRGEVKITSKERCHIGAVFGNKTFKISYTKSTAGDWF